MSISQLIAWLTVTLSHWRRSLAASESGQGLVEYALILVLVVLVGFIVIVFIGPWVGNIFSNVIHNI